MTDDLLQPTELVNSADASMGTHKGPYFSDRTMTVEYNGLSAQVTGLSGWEMDNGEPLFDPRTNSSEKYNYTLLSLKQQYESEHPQG